MESVHRFLKPSEKNFFLFGPRGTGKSTWLRAQYPEAFQIDLLDPSIYRTLKGKPERLRAMIAEHPEKKIIVLDEVQKIPEMLDVIHQMIEEKKGLQFIMTGSSARKLKRSGVDLLAGRALRKTLHPFMAAELGKSFDLEKALDRGLLPLVVTEKEPENILQAYAALYLREEVMTEGLVRNIPDFSRFLESISFSHAAQLNVSSVARECQVNQKTAEGYVQILEDLLLSFKIPLFRKKAKRRLVSHPKWYYFDAGVFRSLRPKGPLDRPEEIHGAALEGLVAEHIRAWIAYSSQSDQLFFWRTERGLEVDFVVYGPRGIWAIEVKNSAVVRSQELKALSHFQEDYPESKTILLYRGKEKLKKGNVWCIPCEDFLRTLTPEKPLSH